MLDKIIKTYSYLYSKVNNQKDYTLVPSKLQVKQINNFIELVGERTDNWIFDFLLFQFNRYIDLETRFGKGIIPINWVIGKSAFNKWQKTTKEQLYYVDLFRKKYNLNL